MDSSQSTARSADGSNALFDFAGMDTERPHSEAHTLGVSLAEFHAMHTIYNVNNNTNRLEYMIQYGDAQGTLQPSKTSILQIPNGSYGLTELLQVLNQQMFASNTYPTTETSTAPEFTGFGDNKTNFCIPAFYQDFVPTLNYTDPSNNFAVTASSANTVSSGQNYTGGKVKFASASTARLEIGRTDASYKKYYLGFYIITDNFPGLPNMLGFTTSKARPLPTYNTVNLGQPQSGYGFSLTYTITSTTTGGVTTYKPTYKLNQGSPLVYLDSRDTTVTPTTRNSFTVNGSPATVFTCRAVDCVSLDYPRNIYIVIDQIGGRNRCSSEKFSFGTVFAKVPTNQNFGGTILYEPSFAQETFAPGLTLDNLTVRLYDDNGNPIDWNGGHWTVILNIMQYIDLGSAGMEDVSLGRTYRPYLKRTQHDALHTAHEFARKR